MKLRLFGIGGATLLIFVPFRFFQSSPTSGEITPALLLVEAVAISIAASSVVGAVILRIIDQRFKDRDAKREKAAAIDKAARDEESSEQQILISMVKGMNTLAQGVIDSAAAQVKEREELRTMLETKQEASDGRDKAVRDVNNYMQIANDDTQTKINLHMDAQLKPIMTELTNLKTKVDKSATSEQFRAEFEPIKHDLEQVIQQFGDFLKDKADVQKSTETGRLRRQIAIDAEAARAKVNGDNEGKL